MSGTVSDDNSEIKPQTALERVKSLDIEERRQQVERLKLRGMTNTAIAQLFDVSPKTIQRDLIAIREKNVARVNNTEVSEYMADALAQYDAVVERAWMDYFNTEPESNQRVKFLDLIQGVQSSKVKALKETGFIKVETKKQVDVNINHKILQHWDDELIEEVSRKLLDRGLESDLEEPIPPDEIDVIEAVFVEDDEDEDEELD